MSGKKNKQIRKLAGNEMSVKGLKKSYAKLPSTAKSYFIQVARQIRRSEGKI